MKSTAHGLAPMVDTASDKPAKPDATLHPMAHLNRGEIRAASALLEKQDTPLANAMKAFIRRVDAGEETLARLTAGYTSSRMSPAARPGVVQGIALAPAPGAHRMLLTFAGNTAQFLMPRHVMDMSNTHVATLRDPMRSFGLAGMRRLGETYRDCLVSLRRLISDLGVTEVYCFGASAGGYPALKYGLDLDARGVLVFSPPTTLRLQDDPGATLSKYPQLTRLYSLAPNMAEDMSERYRNSLPRPGTIVIYSPGEPRDAWLARRMQGIAGVEVEEAEAEAKHKTLPWYIANDKIAGTLARLMSQVQYTGWQTSDAHPHSDTSNLVTLPTRLTTMLKSGQTRSA